MEAENKPTEPTAEASGTSLEASSGEIASSSLEQSDGGSDQAAPASGAPTDDNASSAGGPAPKRPGGIKAFFRKVNIYLLLFILIIVIGAVVTIVSYLNGNKTPETPGIVNKNLTADELKQLANSNSTIGDSGQTLTVQGNAIFSGQVLVRSDLNVAGTIKLGGDLLAQNLTASGKVSLTDTQVQRLQVANGTTMQGSLTLQKGINVAGASSFNGPITAQQLTVSSLILSGNAQLRVPNHIAFTGPSPGRSFRGGILGSGGSASVNGSDTTGTVNVSTGSGTSAGCFITLTFSQPFSSTPHVLISPVGSGAGQSQYYVNRSTTSMSLCTANAPPAHQSFAFDYFITG